MGWIIGLSVSILLLLAAIGFGVWAFGERNTYKNDTQAIIDQEVELARQAVATEKDNEFLEREKNPLKSYQGPSQFGSIKIMYPKTWSALIDETSRGAPLDGYLHPDFVPGLQSNTAFALRIEVVNNTYDQEMRGFEGMAESQDVTVTPYRAPKVPDVLGARVNGKIGRDEKQGSMVLFPLRDKTLKISTQAQSFIKDFNEIILPNLEFSP